MKASVLINNYNYGRFLERAVNSVLEQTYKDVEIIIYDDGSTDDSLQRLANFGEKVKVLARPNYGRGHCWNQVNAINKAFELAVGDVIFLLDSDDWFFEDKIEKVMAVFKSDESVIYVQHKFQLVNEEDKFIKSEKRPFFSKIDVQKQIYFSGRLDFFFTQTSGQCYSTKFLKKILPLDEDELSMICVDIRLTRHAAFAGKIVTLQEKLAAYRIHHSNHSSILKDLKYYDKYDKQQVDFFNNLALYYEAPKFSKHSKVISYIRILWILVYHSKMSIKEKVSFINDWTISFKNKI